MSIWFIYGNISVSNNVSLWPLKSLKAAHFSLNHNLGQMWWGKKKKEKSMKTEEQIKLSNLGFAL